MGLMNFFNLINKKIIIILLLLLILPNLVFIIIISSIMYSANQSNSTVVASVASANEENNHIQSSSVAALQHFVISGSNSGSQYNLKFSFSGWTIDNIVLEDITGTQRVKVKVPSFTGTREEIAYKYFIRQGFTPEGACGLIANIAVESGHTFSPTIEEGFVSYRGETVRGKGYGICQWTNAWNTSYGRRYNLIQHVKKKGIDILADTTEHYLTQLEYAISEPGYEHIVNKIKYSTSAYQAASTWCIEWEIPSNMYATAAIRGASAEDYLKKFKNLNSTDSSSLSDDYLILSVSKRDGKIYFDGTLGTTGIAGSFEASNGSVYGSGDYGDGASSSSASISNPYGNQSFAVTDVALAWRICPYHGPELHDGWDLALGGNGTPIYAVTGGEVVISGPYQGYGNHVVVIKSGDLYVLYGHMCDMNVSVGQMVKQGDKIGAQGSEGFSTGPHLHLEFRKGSLYGSSTANKEAITPMLNQWAYNFSSIQAKLNDIVR